MTMVIGRSKVDAGGARVKKKKKFNRRYLLIPLGLVIGIFYWGFAPRQGSAQYGVCKVFIEKRAAYPLYLDIISVLERPADVRIEYTVVNEFGDTLFNTITCVFRPDPATGFALADVIMNRRKVDQNELIPFNATIPAIVSNPLNLALPAPVSGTLQGLWKEPNYE